MKGTDGHGAPAGPQADELEREVAHLRSDLGELVGELGKRRHAAFDPRRHPLSLIFATAAVVGLVGVGLALVVGHRRRSRSLRRRLDRLGLALRRGVAHPERAFRGPPSVSRKIAAAGGSALASALGRHIAKRLLSE